MFENIKDIVLIIIWIFGLCFILYTAYDFIFNGYLASDIINLDDLNKVNECQMLKI